MSFAKVIVIKNFNIYNFSKAVKIKRCILTDYFNNYNFSKLK